MTDTSFSLDTPEQIAMWRVLSAESMLALEIKTGMKHRYSVLAACQDNGWTQKRTKKGALLDLIAFRRVLDPSYSPSDLIRASFTDAEQKKIDAALRKADKFAVRANANEPGLVWTGV
jgi:hypothetical protein